MTQPQTSPPANPAAPRAASAGVTIGTRDGITTVYTSRDVAAFKARAEQLSRQINSATNRRREVQEALRQAAGPERAGLEARLKVLDDRIVRLEGDIDENGTQLASFPASLATSRGPQFIGFNPGPSRMDRAFIPVAICITLFVLAPIAVSIARMIWRRGSLPRQAAPSPENAQRLERMEQAMDAIAIEVERISEGQRFVTRLLSDSRAGGALGAGQSAAQPLQASMGEKVGISR